MEGQLYLEHVGKDKRERQRLVPLPCTVGRSSECDLQFSRDRISRKHVRFEKHPDGLRLVDLDTTNGTFVNLERIDKPTLVGPGDSIHFADHEFRLIVDDSSGQTVLPSRPNADSTAGHTQVGFTAEPDGFPVQTRAFYELLNDERIKPQVQPVQTTRGEIHGLILTATSTHPGLRADHGNLQQLARQLDEQPRLNAIIRRLGLKAIDESGRMDSRLFIEIQPSEIEYPDVLIEEMESLASQFRGLELVCTVAPVGVQGQTLESIFASLGKAGIRAGLSKVNLSDPRQSALCQKLANYVLVDSSLGVEMINQAVEELADEPIGIIIHRVDDPQMLESLRGMASVYIAGDAAGKPETIT